MTKRRLLTLLGGVAVLAGASWWRLGEANEEPPLPPRAPSQPGSANVPKPQPEPNTPSFSGQTMGTTYTVKYVSPDSGAQDVVQTAVQAALDDVVQAMSTYVPSSEISVLNGAPGGQALDVSPEFSTVLGIAYKTHSTTNGAFDVTIGPLVEAYGFGAEEGSPPTGEQLEKLKQHIGMKLVTFDTKERTIEKASAEVRLDFGGIAKGFGVDQAARTLEKLGIKRYMIEVGGEVRVAGMKTKGRLWKLAIEEPTREGRKIHGTLTLPEEGGALATSGDYRNFRTIDGRLVSHTFDPRTKKPAPRRTASVSVVRPTAAEADALATAFSVLTPEEAVRIANENDYAVYLLTHRENGGFDAHQSEAFEALDFKLLAP